MNSDSAEQLTWKSVAATVGDFVLYWSRLELGLRDAGERFVKAGRMSSGQLKGTFDDRLKSWAVAARTPKNGDQIDRVCNQARKLREIRNLIVHGISGGAAGDGADDSFITCTVGGYDNPAGTRQLNIVELHHATQAVDAVVRSFIDPEYFNYDY